MLFIFSLLLFLLRCIFCFFVSTELVCFKRQFEILRALKVYQVFFLGARFCWVWFFWVERLVDWERFFLPTLLWVLLGCVWWMDGFVGYTYSEVSGIEFQTMYETDKINWLAIIMVIMAISNLSLLRVSFCPICSKKTFTSWGLKCHMTRIHPLHQPFFKIPDYTDFFGILSHLKYNWNTFGNT